MSTFDYKKYLMENRINTSEELDVNEEAPSSKTTVSALKAEIKEMIKASLAEEEKPDGMDVFFGADAKDKMKKRREDAVDFLQKHKEKYGLKEDEDEDEIELDADTGEEDIVEPEMDAAEPAAEPAQSVGFTPEEEAIQTSLKAAYDNATAMGDEKLAAQIGNSITFFTRTHVVER